MPRHRVYIETHLGGGAVLRNKLPAEENIGIDLNPDVVRKFVGFPTSYRFFTADACDFLGGYRFKGDELLYADPPYPKGTRRAGRIYPTAFDECDHDRLLRILKDVRCAVMISSYRNDLYDQLLADWRRVDFDGTSHVGRRVESVWLNFPPGPLHDDRFIGWTFRGRQTFNRKRERWRRRFAAMQVEEQHAVLADLSQMVAKSPDRRYAVS